VVLSLQYHHIPSGSSGGVFIIYAADQPFQPCGDRIERTTMKMPNEINAPIIKKIAK
jgi:hypothetical protein